MTPEMFSDSLSKVSAGMRINSEADDASGYAISERMRVQIRNLDQQNQQGSGQPAMIGQGTGEGKTTAENLLLG
jgi:flagellin